MSQTQKNPPQPTHVFPRCFRCRKGGEHISQKIKSLKQNIQCRCFTGTGIKGYDTYFEQDGDLFYAAITASGVENCFENQKPRCPICGFTQNQMADDYGLNIECETPKCPIIGYDWKRENNMFTIIASGMRSEINNYYLQKERSM